MSHTSSSFLRRLAVLALACAVSACAAHVSTIPGTKITDDKANRQIIDTVEAYRTAVEKRDAPGLLLMASPQYWEDGGTPSGSDDYGYEGLKEVLSTRFLAAGEIRYSMKYVNIRRVCPGGGAGELEPGCRAHVEVLIDASYTVVDARNRPQRRDQRDQNELLLEWNGERWLFLSGM